MNTLGSYKTLKWLFTSLLLMASNGAEEVGTETMKRVCQNSVLTVACEDSQQLVIKKALFGRTERNTKECGEQSTTKCRGKETVHIVAATCALKTSCKVSTTTSTFGNPCPGVWKYLQIHYACAEASSIRSICDIEPVLYLKPGDHGYLTSPNYPDVYDNKRQTCHRELITSYGVYLDVIVFHANFPDGILCTDDYLVLLEQTSGNATYVCNDVDNKTERTNLRNATVIFETIKKQSLESDYLPMAKGFILEYRVRGCPYEELPHPIGANVENFHYGKAAKVSCPAGFQLKENLSGDCVCEGNDWVFDGPLECQPIPCDRSSIQDVEHATPEVSSDGRMVDYACNAGYFPMNGTLGSLHCIMGEWRGELSHCEVAECSLASLNSDALRHMKMVPSSDGNTVNFRCRYGYLPKNGSLGNVTCEKGNWMGVIGECIEAAIGSSCKCHKVAFSVQLSPGVIMVAVNKPIPYDVVTVNDGNSYDKEMHIFEAPIDGVYLFSWSIHGTWSNTEVLLVKDGETVTSGWVAESMEMILGEERLNKVSVHLVRSEERWGSDLLAKGNETTDEERDSGGEHSIRILGVLQGGDRPGGAEMPKRSAGGATMSEEEYHRNYTNWKTMRESYESAWTAKLTNRTTPEQTTHNETTQDGGAQEVHDPLAADKHFGTHRRAAQDGLRRHKFRISSCGQKLLKLQADEAVWLELRTEDAKQERIMFMTTNTVLPTISFAGHLLYAN